tara:strand:- start:559 stop:1467 length:909 start_codon:yes stop_codon:yes gene_type:complete
MDNTSGNMKVSYHGTLFSEINSEMYDFQSSRLRRPSTGVRLWNRVLDTFENYDCHVDINLHCNIREIEDYKIYRDGLNVKLHVHQEIGKSIPGGQLCWVPRKIIEDERNLYDIYIYADGDIGFPYEVIDYHNEHHDSFWNDKVALRMMRCEVDSEYTFYQKKIDYKELGYLSFEFSDGLEFYATDYPQETFMFDEGNRRRINDYYHDGGWMYSQEQIKTFMKTKWWTEPMTKYGDGVTAANMGMNDPLHGVFDSTAVALVDGKIDSRSRILHFGNHDITDMKAQDISHGKEEIKFEGMYRDE